MDDTLKIDEFMRICRSSIRKAQAESRRLGVANVYFLNGRRYYELPNGEFSLTQPSNHSSATLSGNIAKN